MIYSYVYSSSLQYRTQLCVFVYRCSIRSRQATSTALTSLLRTGIPTSIRYSTLLPRLPSARRVRTQLRTISTILYYPAPPTPLRARRPDAIPGSTILLFIL